MPNDQGNSQKNKEKINIRPVSTPPRVRDSKKPSSVGDSKQMRNKMIDDLLLQLQPEAPQENTTKPTKNQSAPAEKSNPVKKTPQTQVSTQPPDQKLVRQAAAKLSTALKTSNGQLPNQPKTQAKQQAKPKPKPAQANPVAASLQTPEAVDEETTLKKWLGIVLLAFIPIVNIIATIIWIKSPKTPPTQRAFARAALIWIIVLWVVLLIVVSVLLMSIAAAL